MDSPSAFSSKQKTVIFLFPEILRPEKLNHAHMYELLSKSLRGYVFTMSSRAHNGTAIASFAVHSGALRSISLLNWMIRSYVQIVLPIRLLARSPRVDAIITYDPYGSGLPAIILKLAFRAKLIVQIMGDYHRLDP